MSKAALKKILKQMSQDQLIELIGEIYDARREAKEYLEYWISPDPDNALIEAQEKVDKLFFFSSGAIRKSPTATQLKQIVKDFSSIIFDPDKVAFLYLHIAVQHYNWVIKKKSGFSTAEAAVRRSFTNAENYITSQDLEEKFGNSLERLKELMDDFFSNPPAPKYRRRRRWW